MKKPTCSGKLNDLPKVTPMKSGLKARSAGSWKRRKDHALSTILKLKGCLRPSSNWPGTDTPTHRQYIPHFLLKTRLIFYTEEKSDSGRCCHDFPNLPSQLVEGKVKIGTWLALLLPRPRLSPRNTGCFHQVLQKQKRCAQRLAGRQWEAGRRKMTTPAGCLVQSREHG